jgi:hypothetical protein
VARLTVPAAATAMIAAKPLTTLRRVRSRPLLLNQFVTLMPPYPAGVAGYPC